MFAKKKVSKRLAMKNIFRVMKKLNLKNKKILFMITCFKYVPLTIKACQGLWKALRRKQIFAVAF